jgi:hypothetical protein
VRQLTFVRALPSWLGSFGSDEGWALTKVCRVWSHLAYWACDTAFTLESMSEWSSRATPYCESERASPDQCDHWSRSVRRLRCPEYLIFEDGHGVSLVGERD